MARHFQTGDLLVPSAVTIEGNRTDVFAPKDLDNIYLVWGSYAGAVGELNRVGLRLVVEGREQGEEFKVPETCVRAMIASKAFYQYRLVTQTFLAEQEEGLSAKQRLENVRNIAHDLSRQPVCLADEAYNEGIKALAVALGVPDA